jgi:hypothetical protein
VLKFVQWVSFVDFDLCGGRGTWRSESEHPRRKPDRLVPPPPNPRGRNRKDPQDNVVHLDRAVSSDRPSRIGPQHRHRSSHDVLYVRAPAVEVCGGERVLRDRCAAHRALETRRDGRTDGGSSTRRGVQCSSCGDECSWGTGIWMRHHPHLVSDFFLRR